MYQLNFTIDDVFKFKQDSKTAPIVPRINEVVLFGETFYKVFNVGYSYEIDDTNVIVALKSQK